MSGSEYCRRWREQNPDYTSRYYFEHKHERMLPKLMSTGGLHGTKAKRLDREITDRMRAEAYRAFENGGDPWSS